MRAVIGGGVWYCVALACMLSGLLPVLQGFECVSVWRNVPRHEHPANCTVQDGRQLQRAVVCYTQGRRACAHPSAASQVTDRSARSPGSRRSAARLTPNGAATCSRTSRARADAFVTPSGSAMRAGATPGAQVCANVSAAIESVIAGCTISALRRTPLRRRAMCHRAGRRRRAG